MAHIKGQRQRQRRRRRRRGWRGASSRQAGSSSQTNGLPRAQTVGQRQHHTRAHTRPDRQARARWQAEARSFAIRRAAGVELPSHARFVAKAMGERFEDFALCSVLDLTLHTAAITTPPDNTSPASAAWPRCLAACRPALSGLRQAHKVCMSEPDREHAPIQAHWSKEPASCKQRGCTRLIGGLSGLPRVSLEHFYRTNGCSCFSCLYSKTFLACMLILNHELACSQASRLYLAWLCGGRARASPLFHALTNLLRNLELNLCWPHFRPGLKVTFFV